VLRRLAGVPERYRSRLLPPFVRAGNEIPALRIAGVFADAATAKFRWAHEQWRTEFADANSRYPSVSLKRVDSVRVREFS